MGPRHSVALLRLRAATGLGVTLALTAGLASGLADVVAPVLEPTGRPRRLDDLLLLGCALVLVPAWCRLALGIVVCLGETLVLSPRGTAPSWLRPALARRVAALVVGSSVGSLIGAVGAPVTAGTADPAVDSAPDGTTVLPVLAARSSLPLPRRVVGGLAAAAPRPPLAGSAGAAPGDTVVVRPGDTLWALASRHLVASDAPDRRVDAGWQRLYAANRATLGPDPDLIRPGTRLDLPATAPTEGHP